MSQDVFSTTADAEGAERTELGTVLEALGEIIAENREMRSMLEAMQTTLPRPQRVTLTLGEIAGLVGKDYSTVWRWSHDATHWLRACRVRGARGLFKADAVYEQLGLKEKTA